MLLEFGILQLQFDVLSLFYFNCILFIFYLSIAVTIHAGLDPDVAHIIVKAGGRAPLVRRSAKGSTDVRVAALTVLRDIAKAGHSLLDSGPRQIFN